MSIGVGKHCYAPQYSYGEICVYCNCCGRINKKTMYKARLKFHKEMLKEQKNFSCWANTADMIALQKKNIGLNIKWHTRKIAIVKRKLKEKDNG